MEPGIADVLRTGELTVVGRMPYSSNATLLVQACLDDVEVAGIYKPARGEQPLWDFPSGLYRREVAAHELSRALGWEVVPVTVARLDGPFDEGSIQAFVAHDPNRHYFTLHDEGRYDDQLRRLCAFDLIANATDRKGGHVLVDADDHIWAIDNGLSFHAEFKLRTVIWDFAHEPVPDDVRAAAGKLAAEDLPESLAALLDPFERDALLTRAQAVADAECFPHDPTGRRHPWPLV